MNFNGVNEHFRDASPHLVPVVVPAIGPGYDHHPVFSTVWLLGRKRLYQPETHPEQDQQCWLTHISVRHFWLFSLLKSTQTTDKKIDHMTTSLITWSWTLSGTGSLRRKRISKDFRRLTKTLSATNEIRIHLLFCAVSKTNSGSNATLISGRSQNLYCDFEKKWLEFVCMRPIMGQQRRCLEINSAVIGQRTPRAWPRFCAEKWKLDLTRWSRTEVYWYLFFKSWFSQ